jgi:hypothetical protein
MITKIDTTIIISIGTNTRKDWVLMDFAYARNVEREYRIRQVWAVRKKNALSAVPKC